MFEGGVVKRCGRNLWWTAGGPHGSMESESEECCVRVAVHVRPLIEKETSEGCEECVYTRASEPDVVLTRGGNNGFAFDYVFGAGGRKTEDLYTVCARPLVADVLKGFNATILAYGQTGSGKTFTMGTGDPHASRQEGVAPRAIADVFRELSKLDSSSWTAKVSFVELHREDLRDLLSASGGNGSHAATGGGLSVREVDGKGVYIAGAIERDVRSAEEVDVCLEEGSLARVTASTEMNSSSSRSHAILILNIEQQVVTEGEQLELLRGKLHLVDLAGSERAKRTKAEGQRFREGVSINKGLLALGKVISALVDGQNGGGSVHVPYRDSKLTRLLQDSLGGNSRTIMIACVSPADVNLDETLNTLKYAARARRIRNVVVQNVQLNDAEAELSAARRQLQEARGQIEQLRSTDTAKLLHALAAAKSENRRLRELLEQSQQSSRNSDCLRTGAEAGGAVWETDLDDADGEDTTVEDIEETDAWDEDCGLDAQEIVDTSAEAVEPALDEQQNEQARMLEQEMEMLEQELEVKQAQMIKMEQQFDVVTETTAKYETRIEALEEERRKLRVKLRELEKAQDVVRAEERNRSTARLKELEKRISELRSQIRDNDRLQRERESAEEQHRRLRTDILHIKQQKATLAKKMEQSARQYRDEVRTREHEIKQLRKQDRLYALRVQRLEQKQQQQSAILERKNKETETVKRRLRDAMARLEGHTAQPGSRATQSRKQDPAAAVAARLDKHVLAQAEIAELRRIAEEEHVARAEVAGEAGRMRRRGSDDTALQKILRGHNERIREVQAKLVQRRAELEGAQAEFRRWGRIRSANDARAVLEVVFGAAVESRALLAETQRELSQKSSELEVAMMRLKVEESARTAREKQYGSSSQNGQDTNLLLPAEKANAFADNNGGSPDSPETDSATITPVDSGPPAQGQRWLSLQDAGDSDDTSDADEAQDDADDPEWELENATPVRRRYRKRTIGTASTNNMSSSYETTRFDPAGTTRKMQLNAWNSRMPWLTMRINAFLVESGAESQVLQWINIEKKRMGEEPAIKVTIPLLKRFLKGQTVHGVPFRASGKGKAALINDALALISMHEVVADRENQPPEEDTNLISSGDQVYSKSSKKVSTSSIERIARKSFAYVQNLLSPSHARSSTDQAKLSKGQSADEDILDHHNNVEIDHTKLSTANSFPS